MHRPAATVSSDSAVNSPLSNTNLKFNLGEIVALRKFGVASNKVPFIVLLLFVLFSVWGVLRIRGICLFIHLCLSEIWFTSTQFPKESIELKT